MEQGIVCNLKNCRKKLTEYAWVTSCSHVLCDSDGYEQFRKALKCPICKTPLEENFDFIRVNFNVESQSILMCGLSPDIILDICSRAITFWAYQIHLEILHQEHLANSAKEELKQMEIEQQEETNEMQLEVSCLEKQLELIKNEITLRKQTVADLTEKFSIQNKENQKLQLENDNLRKKLTVSNLYSATGTMTPRFGNSQSEFMEIGENNAKDLSKTCKSKANDRKLNALGHRQKTPSPLFNPQNFFSDDNDDHFDMKIRSPFFSRNKKSIHAKTCPKRNFF